MGLTYQLNKPQVAWEDVGGDVILLHFGSGFYYNLHGTGADVCNYLLAGGSPDAAANILASHFGLAAERVLGEINDFVEFLLQERLVIAAQGEFTGQPMRVTADAYERPQCQKFEDMADQLLLDKIDDQSPGGIAS